MPAAIQHSYVSGREMMRRGALRVDESTKVHTEDLARLGINLVAARPGTMDSALVGPAVSPGFIRPELLRTTVPGVIRALTTPNTLDELLGVTVAGNWYDEELAWLTAEPVGKAELYGDHSNVPLASWRPGMERRGVVRGELGFMVGLLEEARQTAGGFSTAEEKRRAVREGLELFRQEIGWRGFAGGLGETPIYGLLNDPGLGAYETMTSWVGASFGTITSEIMALYSQLEDQSGGRITDQSRLTLGLPLGYLRYLSVTNSASATQESVREWIAKLFPNMRIVFAREFVGANGGANVAYLFADELQTDDDSPAARAIDQIVPTKYQLLGTETRVKGFIEDATNATAGVVVTRPWAVVRGSGL